MTVTINTLGPGIAAANPTTLNPVGVPATGPTWGGGAPAPVATGPTFGGGAPAPTTGPTFGGGTPAPVPAAPVMQSGGVSVSDGTAKATPNTPIEISSTGSWLGSGAAWAANALVKAYQVIASPVKGFLTAGVVGEAKMDFNAQGGEVVGVYGLAEGRGTLGAESVNDIVGVSGTAYKNAPAWAAGGHFDVYDNAAGGTAIGVNIEMIGIKPHTNGIGVNIQPYADAAPIDAINLQNKIKSVLNCDGAQVDYLAEFNSASRVFSAVPAKQVIGKLRIKIDGSDYWIPVYA